MDQWSRSGGKPSCRRRCLSIILANDARIDVHDVPWPLMSPVSDRSVLTRVILGALGRDAGNSKGCSSHESIDMVATSNHNSGHHHVMTGDWFIPLRIDIWRLTSGTLRNGGR